MPRPTADELAEWGNLPLNERVLRLLATILIAADEIRDMVESEHGFEPFDGFTDSLRRIKAEAAALMLDLEP